MKPNIVVIDGHTMNPGDLDWAPLEAIGTLTVHPRTPEDQVVERLAEADAVLTNKVPFDAKRLAALPRLRYIGVTATGYNIIDTDAAARQDITVTNVPAYSTDTVAQHTIALLLELARHTAAHGRAVAEGQWVNHDDFSFTVAPIMELTGKTMGLVGFGQIGRATAKIAAAMGMRLLVHTRTPPRDDDGLGIETASLDKLFAKSDVLSLHCPLTPETKHLVSASRLATMKRSAFVINTGRGPLIDAAALAEALKRGTIAGAAVDVLDAEPPPADDPLLSAPNCLITPHVAWTAREARQRLLDQAAANLRAFLDGRPLNVVG